MKVYLSGPMSGYPAFNKPLFIQAAEDLRAQGYEVVSPVEADADEGLDTAQLSGDIAELKEKTGHTWGELLARDVKIIADDSIQGVVVLPQWYYSKGARLEVFEGMLLGLPVFAYDGNNAPRPLRQCTVLWFIQQSFE